MSDEIIGFTYCYKCGSECGYFKIGDISLSDAHDKESKVFLRKSDDEGGEFDAIKLYDVINKFFQENM